MKDTNRGVLSVSRDPMHIETAHVQPRPRKRVERALGDAVGLAAHPTVGLDEALGLLPENSFKHPAPHSRERNPYRLIPSSPPRSPGFDFEIRYLVGFSVLLAASAGTER